jgi:tetratricopeptide (TPR) repeat protein
MGAIEDLNKAIELKPNYALAYFTRANITSKLLDKSKTENRKPIDLKDIDPLNAKSKNYDIELLKFDIKMILADLDKTIELQPDFSFAYYNKANALCTQKDFKTAISNYTKSIEIDPDFAEAYFNRGLTYLFINEESKGISDLSKAGELGIFKAYNLIQRFKKLN